MFRTGVGSSNGVIGYDKVNGRHEMIPKTAQKKSIFHIQQNAGNKIYLILSKQWGSVKYDKIEYVISPKALFSLQQELPLSLRYESNLFPIKNPPISDISKTGGQ